MSIKTGAVHVRWCTWGERPTPHIPRVLTAHLNRCMIEVEGVRTRNAAALPGKFVECRFAQAPHTGASEWFGRVFCDPQSQQPEAVAVRAVCAYATKTLTRLQRNGGQGTDERGHG